VLAFIQRPPEIVEVRRGDALERAVGRGIARVAGGLAGLQQRGPGRVQQVGVAPARRQQVLDIGLAEGDLSQRERIPEKAARLVKAQRQQPHLAEGVEERRAGDLQAALVHLGHAQAAGRDHHQAIRAARQ
jgi:hypothetical protein